MAQKISNFLIEVTCFLYFFIMLTQLSHDFIFSFVEITFQDNFHFCSIKHDSQPREWEHFSKSFFYCHVITCLKFPSHSTLSHLLSLSIFLLYYATTIARVTQFFYYPLMLRCEEWENLILFAWHSYNLLAHRRHLQGLFF